MDLWGINMVHAVAPKQTWGPLIFFQSLSSYNINNQQAKCHNNRSAGSVSVE